MFPTQLALTDLSDPIRFNKGIMITSSKSDNQLIISGTAIMDLPFFSVLKTIEALTATWVNHTHRHHFIDSIKTCVATLTLKDHTFHSYNTGGYCYHIDATLNHRLFGGKTVDITFVITHFTDTMSSDLVQWFQEYNELEALRVIEVLKDKADPMFQL